MRPNAGAAARDGINGTDTVSVSRRGDGSGIAVRRQCDHELTYFSRVVKIIVMIRHQLLLLPEVRRRLAAPAAEQANETSAQTPPRAYRAADEKIPQRAYLLRGHTLAPDLTPPRRKLSPKTPQAGQFNNAIPRGTI